MSQHNQPGLFLQQPLIPFRQPLIDPRLQQQLGPSQFPSNIYPRRREFSSRRRDDRGEHRRSRSRSPRSPRGGGDRHFHSHNSSHRGGGGSSYHGGGRGGGYRGRYVGDGQQQQHIPFPQQQHIPLPQPQIGPPLQQPPGQPQFPSNIDRADYWAEKFLAANNELTGALRANANLQAETARLSRDLAHANTERLDLEAKLTTRGAMDLLERTRFQFGTEYTRAEKYALFYDTDEEFRENVRRQFNFNLGRQAVGRYAADLWNKTSNDIHFHFTHWKRVIIKQSIFTDEERKLLLAICETLPVVYELQP